MTQNAIGFPTGNKNDVSFDRIFGEPLQASGNLTYLEFIAVVKALWENAYPDIKIKPSQRRSLRRVSCYCLWFGIKKNTFQRTKAKNKN
jgi:hypothetical protein